MLRIPSRYKNPAIGFGMVLVLVIGASIIPWTSEQPQAAADVSVTIEQFGRYIREWSLWMDVKILVKTALVVFKQENAY